MTTAVRLQYRGCPDSAHLARYYELAGLVVGERYEVAEVFEAEGQLMVRPVGAERWPAPGHPLFGLQPEHFETTSLPIPIVSCGFRHNAYLTDFFGTILTRPEHIQAIQELDRVELPDEDEDFADWLARVGDGFAPEAAAAHFELFRLPVPCDLGVFDQVFLADEPLPPRLAYIGCFLAELARHEVSPSVFDSHLGRMLNALEIRGFEIGEISVCFWQGTGGGDRLINAPPDSRFIYGTLNEPAEPDATGEED